MRWCSRLLFAWMPLGCCAGEPGNGLAILRDGRVVDRVGEESFRRLFLQLYLGDQPPTAALRDGLLGRGR